MLKRREVAGLLAAGALGAAAGAARLSLGSEPRASLPVVLGQASLLHGGEVRVFPEAGVAAVPVHGGFAFVRMRCTHLGCTLRLVGQEFVCPCHGGRFSLAGEPTAGPPRAALVFVEGGVDEHGRLWCDPERERTTCEAACRG